jgi:hypothetical protein
MIQMTKVATPLAGRIYGGQRRGIPSGMDLVRNSASKVP